MITGQRFSADPRFRAMVRMTTPDAVLTGVELLAEKFDRADVAVVDVGGATTDVHSYVAMPMPNQGLRHRLRPEERASRTVEADLGLRWSAESLVEAAARDELIGEPKATELLAAAHRRTAAPSAVSPDAGEERLDLELTALAAKLALRRHAGRRLTRVGRDGAVVEFEGKDLSDVGLVMGTGGVFEHGAVPRLHELLRSACHEPKPRRLLPRSPRSRLDRRHILASAGLLAASIPVTPGC